MDVSDLVRSTRRSWPPGKTAECFIPSTGKYAAFPGDIATVGLYYRQDLLDQAGVTDPGDLDLGRVHRGGQGGQGGHRRLLASTFPTAR